MNWPTWTVGSSDLAIVARCGDMWEHRPSTFVPALERWIMGTSSAMCRAHICNCSLRSIAVTMRGCCEHEVKERNVVAQGCDQRRELAFRRPRNLTSRESHPNASRMNTNINAFDIKIIEILAWQDFGHRDMSRHTDTLKILSSSKLS